jgi:hypothetical protein
LNSIFRAEYKNKYRQYAVNQLYRAHAAFADYHEARALTQAFLGNGTPSNPSSRRYFHALSRWESCLLNIQIFIDVMNKMKKDLGDTPVFTEGDGTPEQRAYALANLVKHWGTEIFAAKHNEGDTVPVWLSNTTLKSRDVALAYEELATLVSQLAGVADELQDASSFFRRGDV